MERISVIKVNTYTLKGIADILTENAICNFSKVKRTKVVGGD